MSNVRRHVQLSSSYVLDREAIKRHAYQLICLFYANKKIARLSDPMHDYPDAAALLERAFFPRELTRLLLNIAIALRTLDDQMNAQPAADPVRVAYVKARDTRGGRANSDTPISGNSAS